MYSDVVPKWQHGAELSYLYGETYGSGGCCVASLLLAGVEIAEIPEATSDLDANS